MIETGTSKFQVTKSLPPALSGRISRKNKVNESSSTPVKRRPPKVSESERKSNINKGNQSTSVSTSSSVRRKIYGGTVSDSKPSPKLKTRDQSPSNSLMIKKSQLTSNPSSIPTRIRRVNSTNNSIVRMQKGFISTPPMSPSRTCTRKCCHVSDMDSSLKIRGRLSPFPLSPLSPYVSNQRNRRGSLSPLALSPLSPYVRKTCGHVSD